VFVSFPDQVERLLHYANELEQEAPAESSPDREPAQDWPAHGQIDIRNAVMRYRDNLPDVLHGITLNIKAGERIGVVGRTGAGSK
jgi:ABC-type bacteriocin/lantibiotic exporter with double-glycine peptidase domain